MIVSKMSVGVTPESQKYEYFFAVVEIYDEKKKYKLSEDMAPEMGSLKVFPSMECLIKRVEI